MYYIITNIYLVPIAYEVTNEIYIIPALCGIYTEKIKCIYIYIYPVFS